MNRLIIKGVLTAGFGMVRTAVLLAVLVASSQAQTVTRNNDLTFGTMFPGVPKTIDKNSSDAVEFHVGGTADAEITLTFSLPTYMYSNGHHVQMVFFSDGCAIDSNATPNQSSPTWDDLNPWQTHTYRLGSTGLTVWLGGKAIPGLKQEAGSYSGDIVLTVEYTGN